MHKPFGIFLLSTMLVFITGCIIPGARRERAELELQRNDSLFVIDEGDFHFRITLPKDIMINNEPSFHHNEKENKLIIKCGPTFHLIADVSKAPLDINPTHEGIFRLEVIDNEDQSVLFRRILPNGVVHDYGIIQQTEIEGMQYCFRSDPNAEYSLKDVLRMRSALASIKI